jgi:hypothetical protein
MEDEKNVAGSWRQPGARGGNASETVPPLTSQFLLHSPPRAQAKISSRRETVRRRAAFAREIAFAEFKEKRAGWATLSRLVWGRP